jgi:Ca2+-binding EF-hand superfamily protein
MFKTNESLSPSSLNPASDFSSDFNSVESVIEEIFKSIDVNNTGSIDVNEASRVVLGLNSLVGRNYGEKEVQAFFNALDVKGDNTVSLEEFKEAFLSL